MVGDVSRPNPWDKWPNRVRRMIRIRHSKGEMVRDIASRLGLNKILVGAYLRSMGVNTRHAVLSKDPTPEEIAAMAKEIKECNLAKMRSNRLTQGE